MLPSNATDSLGSPVERSDTHVDRLNALWKLSVQRGLSDPERIRAMLAMAAEVLDMDLVVLGEFGEHYTARYVSDRLSVFPEGTTLAVEDVLCHGVHQSQTSVHFPDLTAHPLHAQDPLVTELDMRTYSGIPVSVGEEARWVLAFLRRHRDSTLNAVDIAYMDLIADWLGNALLSIVTKRSAAAYCLDGSADGVGEPARGRGASAKGKGSHAA